MAVAGLAREAHTDGARPPRRSVLWVVALLGCIAAGASMWLALNSDHVAEPGLQAALMDWITLPYILAGVVAWRRRPESRFGPQAANPTSFHISDWQEEPWTRGCPVCFTAPGVLLDYGTAIREPAGLIHWAGTETSTFWNGYMDGAVRSGERAAREVLAAL